MTTRCRLHGKYPVSNHIPACTLTAHAYFPPQTECFHCKCRKCVRCPIKCALVCVSSGQKPVIHFIRAGHSFAYTSTRRTYSYILPYVTSISHSLFLLLLTSLSVHSMSVSIPFFYYSSLFHSSLSLHFLLQRSYPLPSPQQQPKNPMWVEKKWESLRQREARDRFPPSNSSSTPEPTDPLKPAPHTPGGLIQAFISPNRGTDNHSTPMRSPRYHPCECVWMHLCVCLPLETQSATQRTQEKTWHLSKTERRASKWALDSWMSL